MTRRQVPEQAAQQRTDVAAVDAYVRRLAGAAPQAEDGEFADEVERFVQLHQRVATLPQPEVAAHVRGVVLGAAAQAAQERAQQQSGGVVSRWLQWLMRPGPVLGMATALGILVAVGVRQEASGPGASAVPTSTVQAEVAMADSPPPVVRPEVAAAPAALAPSAPVPNAPAPSAPEPLAAASAAPTGNLPAAPAPGFRDDLAAAGAAAADKSAPRATADSKFAAASPTAGAQAAAVPADESLRKVVEDIPANQRLAKPNADYAPVERPSHTIEAQPASLGPAEEQVAYQQAPRTAKKEAARENLANGYADQAPGEDDFAADRPTDRNAPSTRAGAAASTANAVQFDRAKTPQNTRPDANTRSEANAAPEPDVATKNLAAASNLSKLQAAVKQARTEEEREAALRKLAAAAREAGDLKAEAAANLALKTLLAKQAENANNLESKRAGQIKSENVQKSPPVQRAKSAPGQGTGELKAGQPSKAP